VASPISSFLNAVQCIPSTPAGMLQRRTDHTQWSMLLWLLLCLAFLLQPCAAAEPRNLFAQFDELLTEESFRQVDGV